MCDIKNERVVSKKKVQKFIDCHELSYIETSAKESININRAFFDLINEIIHRRSLKNT